MNNYLFFLERFKILVCLGLMNSGKIAQIINSLTKILGRILFFERFEPTVLFVISFKISHYLLFHGTFQSFTARHQLLFFVKRSQKFVFVPTSTFLLFFFQVVLIKILLGRILLIILIELRDFHYNFLNLVLPYRRVIAMSQVVILILCCYN